MRRRPRLLLDNECNGRRPVVFVKHEALSVGQLQSVVCGPMDFFCTVVSRVSLAKVGDFHRLGSGPLLVEAEDLIGRITGSDPDCSELEKRFMPRILTSFLSRR